ncbi:DNA-directed RNA polymerase core subunit rpc10 [Metarhizium acridum]|nr:DNA-directed RNA polymerase core subunit rpc10 [Metarhizium acridum]
MRSFRSPSVNTPQSDVDDTKDGYESYEPNLVWVPEQVRPDDKFGYSHSRKYEKHRRAVSVSRGREKELYGGPTTLYLHECSLQRLLEPLIHAMEGKITGLDVKDFSRVCQTRKSV